MDAQLLQGNAIFPIALTPLLPLAGPGPIGQAQGNLRT